MHTLPTRKSLKPVNVEELKKNYPTLKILHLTVDTCRDNAEDWYIIGMDKR